VDDDRYQGFFLKSTDILHRRYEVLRAYFVDHRPTREIAAQFGLTYATTRLSAHLPLNILELPSACMISRYKPWASPAGGGSFVAGRSAPW
jgi:hypothetical protein